ncbi:hypothetical protein AERO9A_360064 [Aeromonas salmonicida]|nr:hypothetical protein AERO9A_360064 [Aeromonas salmonicida]
MLKLVRGDDDTPDGVISCLLLVNQIAVFFQTATGYPIALRPCLKSHEVTCDEENTDSTQSSSTARSGRPAGLAGE